MTKKKPEKVVKFTKKKIPTTTKATKEGFALVFPDGSIDLGLIYPTKPQADYRKDLVEWKEGQTPTVRKVRVETID